MDTKNDDVIIAYYFFLFVHVKRKKDQSSMYEYSWRLSIYQLIHLIIKIDVFNTTKKHIS